EPEQQMPEKVPAPGDVPSLHTVVRYVTLGVHFSIFRNGAWAPPQASRGKLFDKPLPDPGAGAGAQPAAAGNAQAIETLYTLKAVAPWSVSLSGNIDAAQTSITVSSDSG